MPPDMVAAVIDAIAESWTLPANAEVTLEANPTSVEADKFAGFRSAGVNRLSMGVQALNDHDLKQLGRMHSAREAISAFEIARTKFGRVSFDLIYARQNQTTKSWQEELTRAIDMAVDHLSLYQLTIEPETRFGELARRGKLRGLPGDDVATEMYFVTQEICDAAGLRGYEVSNHARQGAECGHNLVYWNYGDYVGIGPGAHGRITLDGTRHASETHRIPETWLDAVTAAGHGNLLLEPVTGIDQALEYLLMGMRLTQGIELNRYKSLCGEDLNTVALSELQESGYLEQVNGRLRATPKGRPVLNYLINSIIYQ